jgi:adenylosuccinate synthase
MKSILVSGLGFGDCGKGSVVDLLTRVHSSKLNVRYSGGAQASHNVVTSDGKHHCFAQWGSGTFAGAKTYLSKYMLVNPTFMVSEGEHLISLGVTDAFERMTIDQNALLTTPFHVSLNRLRETSRRIGNTLEHGTCGMGIGETVDFATRHPGLAIRMQDVFNQKELASKLERLQIISRLEAQSLIGDMNIKWPDSAKVDFDILEDRRIISQFIDVTEDLLRRGVRIINSFQLGEVFNPKDTVIFEGAQGALLDEEWGFHPHTTWSDCTFGNALKLLKRFPGTRITKIGVTRPYHTRHGEGPLPSEGMDLKITDHNVNGPWQGDFRIGHFDFVMARYAQFIVGSLDCIAVNHLDQVSGPQKVCIGHNFQGSTLYKLRSGINFDMHQDLEVMCKAAGDKSEPIQSVVSPVYTELKDVDRLVDGISRVFKAPIVIRGYGPTAEDKQCLPFA